MNGPVGSSVSIFVAYEHTGLRESPPQHRPTPRLSRGGPLCITTVVFVCVGKGRG